MTATIETPVAASAAPKTAKKVVKGKGAKASKKGAKAQGKKETAKKEPKAPRKPGDLTGNEAKVLTALKNTNEDKTMTRAELAEKTDIAKGWSKLLGAPTIEEFGNGENGLEPRGLVSSVKDGRSFQYHITAKGRKALADHKSNGQA